MRYIDSGTRSAEHALGSWLREVGEQADEIVAFRAQSGFFAADALVALRPIVEHLTGIQGPVRILIGSNDGGTQGADVVRLLEFVGPSRNSLDIGIVSYARGFFHPKTIHLTRADSSMAAYVGSANLTRSGVTALHVEAGLILDSRNGDDKSILGEIGAAVDYWFDECPNGLFTVRSFDDVLSLIDQSVVGVPRPPARRLQRFQPDGGAKSATLSSLVPLFPLLKSDESGTKAPFVPSEFDEEGSGREVVTIVQSYQKRLTASDAQRKKSGNQRGSITLVRGDYTFDTQSYFRDEFFSSVPWVMETTRTGETRERAVIPMYVTIDGVRLELSEIEITHASNREAGQKNYTSLLHLGVMAPYFATTDLTGRDFVIDRQSNGTYSLTIA